MKDLVTLVTMSLKWFWLTKMVGIDTRRLNGSPCDDGLKPIPTMSSRMMFEPNWPQNPSATPLTLVNTWAGVCSR